MEKRLKEDFNGGPKITKESSQADDEESEECKKEDKMEESKVYGLSRLPSNWISTIMNDPFGIDDVFEIAASLPVPNQTLKCLLLLKLRRDEALACSVCEMVFFNYIHYLLHSFESDHFSNMIEKGNIRMYAMWMDLMKVFEKDIDIWRTYDDRFGNGEAYYRDIKRGYDCFMGEYENKRRPSDTFLLVNMRHAEVYDPHEESDSPLKWSQERKDEMMESLMKHLSEGIAVCFWCREAFRDSTGYIDHCMTYGHYNTMMESSRCDMLIHITRNMTMLINLQKDKKRYFEFMEFAGSLIPETAEKCWETVSDLMKKMKPKKVPRIPFDLERKHELLRTIRPRLDGKTIDCLNSLPESKELMGILEPRALHFSSYCRQLRIKFPNRKVPLHFASILSMVDLQMMYKLFFRTLDQGIPCCLYCNLVFSSTSYFFIHITTEKHTELYASFCISTPNEIEKCHDTLQMVTREYRLRKKEADFNEKMGTSEVYERILTTPRLSHYCDVCEAPFMDFSYYIAHFWSKEHISRLPPLNDPHYIPYLLKTATKEQLSRIDKKIIDKYPKSGKFTAQDHGMQTRDFYLTLYVELHFRRKFESWRNKQMNYKRDKGTHCKRNEKSVPSIEVENEIDQKMKRRYTRAEYNWMPESPDASNFNNYYTTFPPILIFEEFDKHMKQKEKIPFCSLCELSFTKLEDYYLHFGQDSHPLPNVITDKLAGLALLIHIFYMEKRKGYVPDAYVPLSPL